MRRSWRNKVRGFCLATASIIALAGCEQLRFWDNTINNNPEASLAHDHEGRLLYTCPMHPEIVSNKPGSCPICHMDLEPKDKVLDQITADPNRVVISAQSTVKPKQMHLSDSISLEGIITFDERRSNAVAAYVSGRIEDLFVKYEYTYVKKGQPILTLYSPDLVTAQEEFIFVLNAGDSDLAKQAKKRLRLLGMTEAQLNNLTRTKKPQLKVTVYSAYEGYLKFSSEESTGPANNTPTPVSAGSGGAMSSMGSGTSAVSAQNMAPGASGQNELREGQYVTQGQTLFQVIDLKQVWAVLTAPARQSSGISLGSPVTITFPSMAIESMQGKINLIEPIIREGQQQSAMRVYLENPDEKLRPNTLVRATVKTKAEGSGLVVPTSAVWNIGRSSVVWVRGAPAGANSFLFEAMEVNTGATRGEFIQITGGLSGKELLAKEAGFMIDSESFVRPE